MIDFIFTSTDNLQSASSFADKKPLCEEMLGFQKNVFDIPDYISEALTGLKIDRSTLGFLAASGDTNRLASILETLSFDSILIGEYDIDGEEDNDTSDDDIEELFCLMNFKIAFRWSISYRLPCIRRL